MPEVAAVFGGVSMPEAVEGDLRRVAPSGARVQVEPSAARGPSESVLSSMSL